MTELAAAVRTLAGCPGPHGLPLLGNLHQLDVTRLSTVLEAWADRYGPLYRIRLGGRDALVVADVDAVHTMLRQRPDGYRRLHTIESVLAELGITGAFSAEGQDWRRLRRLAMQSLHADYLRQYSGTVARVTARLHERWARAAATAADIDVQQDMMRYTVDVIAGRALATTSTRCRTTATCCRPDCGNSSRWSTRGSTLRSRTGATSDCQPTAGWTGRGPRSTRRYATSSAPPGSDGQPTTGRQPTCWRRCSRRRTASLRSPTPRSPAT